MFQTITKGHLIWMLCFPQPPVSKDQRKARTTHESGMHFLKCYSKLATKALSLQRPLFVFKPKLHYFHHVLTDINLTLANGGKPLNPLAYSCAMAEDFIGAASRISRRVSARTTQLRVLQRYLAGAYDVWHRDNNAVAGS